MQWPDYWVHCATPQAHNRTQKLIPGPRHPSGVSPCYFKIRGNRRLVAPQSFTCYVGIYPICLASWVSLGSVNSPHPLQSPTLPPTCLSPLRLVMTSRVHCIRAPPTLSDRSLRSVYIIYVAFSPPLVLPNRALQVHLTTCLAFLHTVQCVAGALTRRHCTRRRRNSDDVLSPLRVSLSLCARVLVHSLADLTTTTRCSDNDSNDVTVTRPLLFPLPLPRPHWHPLRGDDEAAPLLTLLPPSFPSQDDGTWLWLSPSPKARRDDAMTGAPSPSPTTRRRDPTHSQPSLNPPIPSRSPTNANANADNAFAFVLVCEWSRSRILGRRALSLSQLTMRSLDPALPALAQPHFPPIRLQIQTRTPMTRSRLRTAPFFLFLALTFAEHAEATA